MTTDRLFVIMLVLLIPMTGCFGAVDNADAEEDPVVNIVEPPNQLPVIFGEATYYYQYELRVKAQAIDYDGNITQCGVDVTLNGMIDYIALCEDHSYSEVVAITDSYLTNMAQLDDHACYQWASLIAVDDDGGKTIMPFRIFTEYDDENGVCTTNYENREA